MNKYAALYSESFAKEAAPWSQILKGILLATGVGGGMYGGMAGAEELRPNLRNRTTIDTFARELAQTPGLAGNINPDTLALAALPEQERAKAIASRLMFPSDRQALVTGTNTVAKQLPAIIEKADNAGIDANNMNLLGGATVGGTAGVGAALGANRLGKLLLPLIKRMRRIP